MRNLQKLKTMDKLSILEKDQKVIASLLTSFFGYQINIKAVTSVRRLLKCLFMAQTLDDYKKLRRIIFYLKQIDKKVLLKNVDTELEENNIDKIYTVFLEYIRTFGGI